MAFTAEIESRSTTETTRTHELVPYLAVVVRIVQESRALWTLKRVLHLLGSILAKPALKVLLLFDAELTDAFTQSIFKLAVALLIAWSH